jgi:hypothetical protein
MSSIKIGSKVKIRKPENCDRWYTLNCPDVVHGTPIEGLEGIVKGEDVMDFWVSFENLGKVFYFPFPKEAIYLVEEAITNPLAQDSIPIGTVVEWEGEKLKVIANDGCKGCYFNFYKFACTASTARCCSDANTDNVSRQYVLVTNQGEEHMHEGVTRNIKVTDKVRIIASDLVGIVENIRAADIKPKFEVLVKTEEACLWYPESEVELYKTKQEKEMGLQLEDGKKYVTGAGCIVTVVLGGIEDEIHPFRGTNGFWYTIDGYLYSNKEYSTENIVREYLEEQQEPEGHIHAELMIEYGKDALVSKEPWLGWQYWVKGHTIWFNCTKHPDWYTEAKYRRRPKTVLINGYEVPEPLRVAPEEGTLVYLASLSVSPCDELFWKGHEGHLQLLRDGVLHLESNAAQIHTEALLSFTTTVQEKQDEEV